MTPGTATRVPAVAMVDRGRILLSPVLPIALCSLGQRFIGTVWGRLAVIPTLLVLLGGIAALVLASAGTDAVRR